MFASQVIILTTCLLGFRPTVGQSAADCPSGFEYVEEVNVCLKPIVELQNWDGANDKCKKLADGAHLAIILSQKANDAVVSLLNRTMNGPDGVKCKPDGNFWLSSQLSDWSQCVNAPYVWVDPRRMPMIFSSWMPGKPDCKNDGYYCLVATSSSGFKWSNSDCLLGQYCSLCEV